MAFLAAQPRRCRVPPWTGISGSLWVVVRFRLLLERKKPVVGRKIERL